MSKPIEDYALVGDTHTAALVARDGSVDWLCLPRFDSPAIFAALLDERAGRRSIAPAGTTVETTRSYIENTLVLETTFTTGSGTATLTDLMPLERTLDVDDPTPIRSAFLRLVACTEGSIEMNMEFSPRFGYGREEPALSIRDVALWAEGDDLSVVLRSDADLEVTGATATSTFTLVAGQTRAFVLQMCGKDEIGLLLPEDVETGITTSVGFWRSWLGRCPYRGGWQKEAATACV